MDFKDKIKHVLDYERGLEFRRRKHKTNNLDIKISTKILNFVDRRFKEYRDFFYHTETGSEEYFPYYSLTVYEEDKALCSVTLSGQVLLSNFTFMNNKARLSFFNVKDTIYMDCSQLKDVKEVRCMFSTSRLSFKDWNVDLYSVLGNKRSEILFFNGVRFLSLLPTRIIFSQEDRRDYLKHTDLKKESSKCDLCGVNEYIFLIEDNPVIPPKSNKVCKSCLKVLEKTPTHK